jgi:hypothetical protein
MMSWALACDAADLISIQTSPETPNITSPLLDNFPILTAATMASLFTVPISSTGGSIVCTNPSADKEHANIYVLTFTSPKDNRLTPIFIDALLLALDIIEHRYPKGVVVTTSGIAKFYSNGLDLDIVGKTEGFLENWLWRLFRRFLT